MLPPKYDSSILFLFTKSTLLLSKAYFNLAPELVSEKAVFIVLIFTVCFPKTSFLPGTILSTSNTTRILSPFLFFNGVNI